MPAARARFCGRVDSELAQRLHPGRAALGAVEAERARVAQIVADERLGALDGLGDAGRALDEERAGDLTSSNIEFPEAGDLSVGEDNVAKQVHQHATPASAAARDALQVLRVEQRVQLAPHGEEVVEIGRAHV